MKYLAITSTLVACSLLNAQADEATVDKAIQLYETRHLNKENLDQSYKMLQEIVLNDPNDLRANYELAKVYYLLGDQAIKKDEKIRLYAKGQGYGKAAIKIDDNSAWAHFWYMVDVGRVGQTKGVLNSLSLVPEIKKEIDRVLKIDPKHTGALDAKAMLYYELPGLLGGNINKSIECLEKAIALDSNYTLLYIDMAKCLIKKREFEKSRWFLNKTIGIQKPTYEADFIIDDKPEAEKLLKQIEGK